MNKRPGGELSKRPLHFIWLADCSRSMSIEGKIHALNNAIREAIPHMQRAAQENPHVEVLVRAIKFSSGAQWHLTHSTPVADFKWEDLDAEDGLTDMGRALSIVADALKPSAMTDRALPPVLVLISDGWPTDDFRSGLNALMEQRWGKKAVRVAIAIGKDANQEILQKFIGDTDLRPLQANNPQSLIKCIKWVSTSVVRSVSSPASQIINSNKSSEDVRLLEVSENELFSTEEEAIW